MGWELWLLTGLAGFAAGLLDSNKKFPAAIFGLTEAGRAAAHGPD